MYLVCNLKNKLLKEDIDKYRIELEKIDKGKVKLVICPSFPYLSSFSSNENNYYLGAQDVSSFQDKTITGEVTGEQLASLNVEYVIVGHSERRCNAREINIDFINKINNCLNNDINVIYCIGETKREKDNNETFKVIEQQISEVLNNVEVKNITIAYEPVWAIGSGITPTREEIKDIIDYIKDIVYDKYECQVNVLYGGSVNEDNIAYFNSIDNLDGILLGGSSLDINKVSKVLQVMNE